MLGSLLKMFLGIVSSRGLWINSSPHVIEDSRRELTYHYEHLSQVQVPRVYTVLFITTMQSYHIHSQVLGQPNLKQNHNDLDLSCSIHRKG